MSVMDLSPSLCRVFCAFNNFKIKHLKDDLLILAFYLSLSYGFKRHKHHHNKVFWGINLSW